MMIKIYIYIDEFKFLPFLIIHPEKILETISISTLCAYAYYHL